MKDTNGITVQSDCSLRQALDWIIMGYFPYAPSDEQLFRPDGLNNDYDEPCSDTTRQAQLALLAALNTGKIEIYARIWRTACNDVYEIEPIELMNEGLITFSDFQFDTTDWNQSILIAHQRNIMATDIVLRFEHVRNVFPRPITACTEEPDPAVLWLNMDKRGRLILNDLFLLTQTRADSINQRMLMFLIDHPNQTFTRHELEQQGVLRPDKNEDKDFFVVLDDIKIKGDMRTLFFGTDLTKHTIHLHNPVRESDFNAIGLSHINLGQLIK